MSPRASPYRRNTLGLPKRPEIVRLRLGGYGNNSAKREDIYFLRKMFWSAVEGVREWYAIQKHKMGMV